MAVSRLFWAQDTQLRRPGQEYLKAILKVMGGLLKFL